MAKIKAMEAPCAACPWRASNQGKPHPHGWYSKKNLRRLWAGLRSGKAPGMTCHPTDPDNEVPEGHRPAPEGNDARECAGALILVQRELKLLEKDPKGYLKARPGGLTKAGLHWWAIARCFYAGTPLGGPSIPVLKDDPDIRFTPIEAARRTVEVAR